MIYASDKKNIFLRMFDMVLTIIRNRSVKLMLIDTYSSKAFYFAWLCGNLAHVLRIPFILILRGGDLQTRKNRKPQFVKALFIKAVRVVAVSKYLENAFVDFHETTHIPNTIDLSMYTFKARKTLRPKLLWVRSLHHVYNPELAIHVVHNLKDKYPDISLVMVGPDKEDMENRLKTLAEESGVEDRVTFTGKLSKEEWIKLSEEYDIFINTTNVDNMPVSVTEAMALGLPVVSTNVGGIPFLITHDENGLLVPPNDTDAFCREIDRLIVHPDFAHTVAQRAREKASSFDNKIVLHQWKSLINEVLQ
jgi:glycosyltransferase involved in cell wall biosynthesis